MKKIISISISVLLFLVIISGCSNENSKVEKKAPLTINPNSKKIDLTIKKDSKDYPIKIKKVFRYKDNNSTDITNKGIIKDTNNKIVWRGIAEKYENVNDLLGDSILYEVEYKNGDVKKFERKINYKK
ncbi:hypothetical protein [Staphylococcus hominis]|uniref:hypothetical protein n=1 Tax=Staphylococcus hominis TaxID=1290 RepID=UPI00066A4AA5|nr:hypothetical protein [Staphylococcus hominis]